MEIQQLKRQFDLKIEQGRAAQSGTIFNHNINYRHAILNEVSKLLVLFCV